MKKLKILAIVCALLSGGMLYAMEFNYGLKAGLSMSWVPGMILEDASRTVLPCPGPYGGAFIEFELADNFLLYTELSYAGLGHIDKFTFYDYFNQYFLRLSYLQIPVFAGFRLLDDRFTLYLGPELGVCLAGNSLSRADGKDRQKFNERANLNPVVLDFALMGQYMFTDHLGIDVKMDFGLTRTFRGEHFVLDYGSFKRDVQNRTHNVGVSLGVCYKFN